ncbi:hypothetical protein FGG08_005633 [Glutinoglossum americanum]|uniref:DNA/RNA-binding domain-containing protein n=1 Tax=Glutinoglossum americanum TaxID=1670608 RepID=A0A9P8L192_9PEZI|nr:hypothetical protein FGG08_005633 [Glutinoglossum americanum]
MDVKDTQPPSSNLDDRFINYKRSSSKVWSCPRCLDRRAFHRENELFTHVAQHHPEFAEGSRDDDDGIRAFREWLAKAAQQDEQATATGSGNGKGVRAALPSPLKRPFKPPFDSHDNGGSADRRGSRPQRATSTGAIPAVPRPRQQPHKEISGMEKLSLGQDQDSIMVDSTLPLFPISTRKRAAVAEPSSSDPSNKLRSPDRDRGSPRVGLVGDAPLQANPTRAKSSRKQPDPEFTRTIPGEGGGELTRPASGSKRLFNPTTDNPNLRSDVVKGLDPANLAPAAAAMAPRVYDKQAHVFRSKKEPQRRKDIRPRDMFPAIPPKQAAQVHAPQSREGGGRSVLVGSPTQPHGEQVYSEKNLGLVLQPETRPISQEQLVAEVKGIYAGLVMVEAKCVDVDNKQARDAQEAGPGKQPKLNNEQWQALIALHRTLLHEHHDFFLASQHRSASPALRRLASKYAMPARMWRHGIHSFLELLRHRLPDSLEHMLAFIYLAYSMMALLYETVPTFEDTWIECLGDLGRYRMAIEDDDIKDREVWTGVARFWYSKAADKSPTVGRLYHHLAILARPNALQQLYYYTRSLSCVQPFLSARESILTLFDPILCGTEPAYHRSLPADTAFIKAHGILFTGVSLDRFDDVVDQFLSLLDNNIGRVTSKWKEQGVYIAVANSAALFGYASKDNLLRIMYTQEQNNGQEAMPGVVAQPDTKTTESGSADRTVSDSAGAENVLPPAPGDNNNEPSRSQTVQPKSTSGPTYNAAGELSEPGTHDSPEASKDVAAFANGKFLTFATLDLALQRIGDPNVLPHVHVSLVFMNHIMHSEPVMKLVENEFPWESLASMLNTLVTTYDTFWRVENGEFPEPEKGVGRPLPEDFNIRGLEWASSYFPNGWFENALVDDEERTLELASMAADRRERILWLAYQLAQSCHCLLYDCVSKVFSVAPDVKRGSLGRSVARNDQFESATISSRTTLQEDDTDIEMDGMEEADEEPQDLDNDSPEMRELRLQQWRLKNQLKSDSLGVPEQHMPTASANANDLLMAYYTTMVCDTNLFLSQLDVFWLMVKTPGWHVVIPNSVITELSGLSRNLNSVGRDAAIALDAIKNAIEEKKDVAIVTSKGNVVTNQGFFYKEQLENYEAERRTLDEVIIDITKQQAQFRRTARPSEHGPVSVNDKVRSAVLVTEDRAMRLKASAYGVAAVAASMVRRVISSRRKDK